MLYFRIFFHAQFNTCRAIVSILAMAALCGSPVSAADGGFPRIANLWGAETSSTDYDMWSKYDMLVLVGAGKEPWIKFAKEVKSRNPNILLLGTAPFENVGAPAGSPWMKDEWYLRRPNGDKVNWWVGQLYAPNLFADGYLDGAVNQADTGYGDLIRMGLADGFMFDSVVGNVRWYGDVDTDRDGIADKTDVLDQKWQQQQNLFLDKLHSRFPDALVLANDVDMRHAPHLNGRLFEGSRALDRIPAGYGTAQEAIFILKDWMKGSRQPGVTFASMSHPIGWQWWRQGNDARASDRTTPGELDRIKRDFPRMRTGLLTTLMSDAYYRYDYGTIWYGFNMWFAEYDAPLGKPLGESREVFTSKPIPLLDWRPGKNTQAFAIPNGIEADDMGLRLGTDNPKEEWKLLLKTTPTATRLKPGKTYRVVMDCEILKRPSKFFQCVIRTAKGGQDHDKAPRYSDAEAGERWHIETTVKLDDYDDYALELRQLGSGALRVTNVKIMEVKDSYFVREFEGGAAVLNPMPHPVTVKLPRVMRRLNDEAAPRYVVDIDDIGSDAVDSRDWELLLQKYRDCTKLRTVSDFAAGKGWITKKADGHQYGETYRAADTAGAEALWTVIAPSNGIYTVYAWVNGGKDLTDSAVYSIVGPGATMESSINQRKYNGEFAQLFDVRLRKGRSYRISLKSGGDGITVADAVRLESAARFNDGSTVRKMRLEALDGALLLSK